ncbi:DUF370 domain-containing protein [bacterium]|nr:DUF370 domain-containing protein [bacterium]
MSNKELESCGIGRSGINVGYGNFVRPHRIVAILESGSLPMKRLREKSQQANLLLDATAGRKTRSLVILDSHHVVLSALAPQTLHERLDNHRGGNETFAQMEGGELVSG